MKSLVKLSILTLLLPLAAAAGPNALPDLNDVENGSLTDEQLQELGAQPEEELFAAEELELQGQSYQPMFISPFRDESLAEVVVIVNKGKRSWRNSEGQTATIYRNGRQVRQFDISTGTEREIETTSGKIYVATTPVGYYRPKRAYVDYHSRTFLGAAMPRAVFFHGGIALHGVDKSKYKYLGKRASGGCVRMHQRDAKYVNNLIVGTGQRTREVADEGFEEEGRKFSRTRFMNRIKLRDLDRRDGDRLRRRISTYDAVIIVKDHHNSSGGRNEDPIDDDNDFFDEVFD